MTASLSTITVLDGNADPVAGGVQALDKSGTGVGPFSFANVIVDGVSGTNLWSINSSNQALVLASQSGTWTTNINDGSGNALTSTGGSLNVNVTNASTGGTSSSFAAAFPATGTASGFSDGTNMQGARVFDGDTGGGTQYVLGAMLRASGSGGTVEAGTSSNPLSFNAAQVAGATIATAASGIMKVGLTSGTGTAITATGSAIDVNIASGGGSGFSVVDEAAFTGGTSAFVPAGGFFQTTATNNALTTGQQGTWQMTANRAGFVNLRNAAGTEIGTATTPVQVSLANTASNATSVNVAVASVSATNISTNVAQINGVTPLMGAGNTGTGSPRVTIATDQAALPTWGHGATGSAVPANAVFSGLSDGTNLRGWLNAANALNSTGAGIGTAQIVGQFDDVTPTSITENQFGNIRMSANRNLYGTIRDAAGNERGANVNSNNQLSVSVDAVSATNISTNIAQMNGVTVTMGNGVSGTGVQRVAIASDNSAVSGLGAAATSGAVPANAVYEGGNAITALPTAATAGNITGISVDKYGRQVVIPNTIRDLIGTSTVTITDTTQTTIAAAAANVFNDLIMVIVSNTSASTNVRVDFKDTTSGSVIFSIQSNGGQPPVGFSTATPIPQSAVNTNWTATASASVTDLRIFTVWAKNK